MLADRLTSQLLAGVKATRPGEVVKHLLAVQAQDLRGAKLAVRARSTGLTAADVDAALADRELLVTWLCRGTLHLVRSEDYPWLQALTTPQLRTGNTRRLQQEGVSPEQAEQAVRLIVRALEGGPQTRDQLREILDAAGVPTAGQALVHLLVLASVRGLIVRGPLVGDRHAYVLVADWLPHAEPVDRDVALGELARRYLVGHAPSDDRDLAIWAGITLTDARRGLVQTSLRSCPPAPLPPPTLLGPFDPLLHGWVSRTEVLAEHTGFITTNGIFRPVLLLQGRAAGTWGLPGGRVQLKPFTPADDVVAAQLRQEADDVERFLRPADAG